MPLGNSITWGWESSDGNGYRLGLQELLSENTVQYIGSQRSGNMTDNYNEGHPGALIDEIANYAYLSLWEMPNIVLVMAGTNDMNTNLNVSTAPERLGSLIDEIVDACPDTAVLVAQLIPSMTKSTDARINAFNAALPGIVASRMNARKKVMEVNMDDYFGEKDLQDDLHPSDEGYLKMAAAWYDGIQEADEKGLISPLMNSTDPVQ
jgi:lysophospholipase L1-like esterase